MTADPTRQQLLQQSAYLRGLLATIRQGNPDRIAWYAACTERLLEQHNVTSQENP